MLTLKATKKDPLHAVAFSPDGSHIAATGSGGVLWVWDLPAGGDARQLRDVGRSVSWVGFLGPDRLAVPNGETVELFRPSDGAALERLALTQPCWRAAPSPDGRALAVARPVGVELIPVTAPETRLWWSPLDATRQFSYANSVGWSADGRTLAVGTYFGEVRLFDATTGASAGGLAGPGTSQVHSVALAPDGRAAAWVAGPGLHLQSLEPGARLVRRTLGRTHFLGVAWHPSGGSFATTNTEGKVDYWDARTCERTQSFDWGVGRLNAIAFDASGDRAVCCSAGGAVVVWDVDR